MIVLTSSDIIRVGLSAATAVDAVACFADNAAASFAPGNQIVTFAVAGPTTVVSAPAALTTRNVSNLGFQARGGANTLDVEVFTGGSAFNLCTVSLGAGDRLEYENGSGWSVTDSNGATKTVAGVPGPGTIPLTSLATQAANTEVGNWTGGVASPTANAVAAESIVARFGGNLGAQGAAVQSAFIRAAGSLFNATCAAGQVLGRTAGGADLGFTNFSTLGLFTSVALQAFTASGTYTPTTGMKFCIVITTGSGGGGGGADASTATSDIGVGGGGGAGGTCIEAFSAATIGASQAVTIGTAGTAGSNTGGNGGAGGNSTFGALNTANGGALGTGSGTSAAQFQVVAGGLGGIPTGGLLNITGGDGESGVGVTGGAATDGGSGTGGRGGGSFWGSGGIGGAAAGLGTAIAATQAGVVGKAFGTGGGGGVSIGTTGAVGGAGLAGCCLVIEFI